VERGFNATRDARRATLDAMVRKSYLGIGYNAVLSS
jgi:hypothetical protein